MKATTPAPVHTGTETDCPGECELRDAGRAGMTFEPPARRTSLPPRPAALMTPSGAATARSQSRFRRRRRTTCKHGGWHLQRSGQACRANESAPEAQPTAADRPEAEPQQPHGEAGGAKLRQTAREEPTNNTCDMTQTPQQTKQHKTHNGRNKPAVQAGVCHEGSSSRFFSPHKNQNQPIGLLAGKKIFGHGRPKKTELAHRVTMRPSVCVCVIRQWFGVRGFWGRA